MTNVAIVTDSAACIPETLLDSLHIHWIPYCIYRGSEVLRDRVTIQPDEFYSWLPTARELPKTACASPGEYMEMYERLARDEGAVEIASIHMTSKGSGAYQAASTAKTMFADVMPNVHVEIIDTLNVAMCHGWMAIESARAALAGKSLADILKLIKKMIPVTRMVQTADTLKYLYMGGRIGRAQHLVGTLLDIKPLIGMVDGIIVPLGTARSRDRAYRAMVDIVETAAGEKGRIKIAYMHAAARQEAEKIKALVEARLTVVESLFAELSPALGVHTGPGMVGLCYYPIE